MKNIELSVIIPAYNSEKYIERMINSLLKNYSSNIEIIVVNDGSTDATKNICMKYKNINLYNIKNQGASYARNYGLKKAIGKYVMFVDADDYLCDNWYSILKKYFPQDHDIIYFNENLNKHSTKKDLVENILNLKLPLIAGPVCKLFKRDLIIKNNIEFPIEVISGEDMIFNLRCLAYSKNYIIDNNSFYMYRLYMGSSTKKFNKKAFDSAIKFGDEVISVLDKMYFLDESTRDDIITASCYDVIPFLSNRISYVKTYKEAKKFFEIFDTPMYQRIIALEYKIKNKKTIKKVVLLLCKSKMYFLVYILYRFRNIIRSNTKEKFVKI